MWELLDKIWEYFAAILTPISIILAGLLIWSERKAYQARERVAEILRNKDQNIERLTNKTLDAVSGYEKLTVLLEDIVRRGRD
jgi:hypothetical protein